MEDVHTVYRGYVIFAFEALATVVMAGVTISCAAAGQVAGVVLCAALTVAGGWDLPRRCVKVELLPDDDLVVHKLLSRRVVDVRAVHTIRFHKGDETPDTFTVAFEGGSFLIGAGRSARALVDAMLRRNPSIRVSGPYARPQPQESR